MKTLRQTMQSFFGGTRAALWLGVLLLAALPAGADAADNNARIHRFRGFRGLWAGPIETLTFSQCGPLTIPSGPAAATPDYPSIITVAGLSRPVAHITVTISGLSHSFPDDIDMLLVNPQGTNIVLMSDCGGNRTGEIVNVTLAFNDTSVDDLPTDPQIVSGTYRPTNYGPGDTLTAPAPTDSRTTTFADFQGRDPNGDWLLYVFDDQGGDSGSITACWSITFSY